MLERDSNNGGFAQYASSIGPCAGMSISVLSNTSNLYVIYNDRQIVAKHFHRGEVKIAGVCDSPTNNALVSNWTISLGAGASTFDLQVLVQSVANQNIVAARV